MEPSKFDDLTKALATATSRRQALKAIAATTIGGFLGLAGIGTAFAKCKSAGDKCNHDHQCCSGLVCQNGTCVTPMAEISCVCNSGQNPRSGCISAADCTANVEAVCSTACDGLGSGLMSATCVPC